MDQSIGESKLESEAADDCLHWLHPVCNQGRQSIVDGGGSQVVCWNWNFDTLCQHHYVSSRGTSIRNWMRGNTPGNTCTQISQFNLSAKCAAKCAMTVNLKCRNDKIRAKRAENKVKLSNIENNLVNARENLSFWCLKLFKMVKNTFCIVRKMCNDGKYM